MKTQTCYFGFSWGLIGCYMPDSHSGTYAVDKRRDLVAAIRDELAFMDAPKSAIRQISIKRLWTHAKRHGTSSLHFTIETSKGYGLNFHGLTGDEYDQWQAEHDQM